MTVTDGTPALDYGWPVLDDLAARLGVPFATPADAADAAVALDAAVDYAERESTAYRRAGRVVTAAVHRGVVDLALALYERRGSTVDPFLDDLTPAQRQHFARLLGVGGYRPPMIGGAAP